MDKIRLLLADDHHLVRAGIRTLVHHYRNMEVVAEAGDGHTALQLAKDYLPDVALVDIGMPGLNGIELVGRLRKECPQVRVLVLSMHTGEEYVRKALQAGAAGYIVKGADVSELEFALRSVMKEGSYLSPSISGSILQGAAGTATTQPAETLTPRQREILQLIAEGHSTKEIAWKLKISIKTVESHRAAIMERLEIYDLPGLIRYAIRRGIIGTE
ncbi:MAG TPA: response regulator transcription factor [Blastocatellia bacterium]|nr:response regulator transcription factor [Blastocatellia bacterium]